MNEFENKTYERIHYSRFIASWINQGGKFDRKGQIQFGDWLDTLTINGKAIPEEVIDDIIDFGSNGKLELQISALKFLAENK